MKKIRLTSMIPPDPGSVRSARRAWQVPLNGRLYLFSRQDQAEGFLVEISRALSQAMVDLNDLSVTVFSFYRQVWPYLEDNTDNYSSQRAMEAAFWEALDALERSTRASGENYQAFVFKDLVLACDSMAAVMDAVATVARSRSDTALKYRCSTIKYYLGEIRKRITHLAADHPARVDPGEKGLK